MKQKSQMSIILESWQTYIEMSSQGIINGRYSMKDIDWDLKQCENDLKDNERRIIKLEIYRRIADLQAKEMQINA